MAMVEGIGTTTELLRLEVILVGRVGRDAHSSVVVLEKQNLTVPDSDSHSATAHSTSSQTT